MSAKGHRRHGTNHRLTLNSGASGKPVERGRENNKLTFTRFDMKVGEDGKIHDNPYAVPPGRATRKLFKKIRNKKRRMLPVDEVPGI